MKKLKLNLEGAKVLSKEQQRSINGGSGDDVNKWSIKCNSGVWIDNAPNADDATVEHACYNQGGYSGWAICTGKDC